MDLRWRLRRDRRALGDAAVTGREFNPVTQSVSQAVEIPPLLRRHGCIGFRGQFVVCFTEGVLHRYRLSHSLFSIDSLKPVTPVTVVTIERNQWAAVSLVVTGVTGCCAADAALGSSAQRAQKQAPRDPPRKSIMGRRRSVSGRRRRRLQTCAPTAYDFSRRFICPSPHLNAQIARSALLPPRSRHRPPPRRVWSTRGPWGVVIWSTRCASLRALRWHRTVKRPCTLRCSAPRRSWRLPA